MKKKVGNGFVYRFIQAVIYLLMAGALLFFSLYAGRLASRSFLDYLYEYENGQYILSVKIDDPQYSEGILALVDGAEAPCLLLLPKGGTEERDGIYLFIAESAEAETIQFFNRETGTQLTVGYSQCARYDSYVNEKESNGVVVRVFSIACAAVGALAVLQLLTAICGRKRAGMNVLCIIINILPSLAYGCGLLGLVGGVKGRMYLRMCRAEEDKTAAVQEEEIPAPAPECAPIGESQAEGERQEFEAEELEYIRPKTSAKGKKAIMIIMILSYALLLIAGVLLVAVPSFGSVVSAMGICREEASRAYAVTIGSMWIALTPTLGFYFASLAPVQTGKKGKVALFLVSLLLLAATNVAFFVVINIVKPDGALAVKSFYETSDVWFIPLSMVFASLGTVVCYLLTFMRIDPAKIKDYKAEMGEGLFQVIKYIVFSLFALLLKIAKGILKFKEKNVDLFILVSTLLLTWLVFFTAFIFAILCIAVFVGAVVMYFAGVIHWAYMPSKQKNKQVTVNDCGTVRTLTHNPCLVGDDRYEQVFEDESGNRWYSTDGGKHVYKKA